MHLGGFGVAGRGFDLQEYGLDESSSNIACLKSLQPGPIP